MSKQIKCLFRKNVIKDKNKEIWTKEYFHVNSEEISLLTKKFQNEGYITYQSTSFLSGNETIYPFLFIDIDATDLEKSKVSTKKIAEYLLNSLKINIDNISFSFSGNKGFHILVDSRCFFEAGYPTLEMFPLKTQKALVEKIASICLAEEDVQPDIKIYSKNRMMRSFFSKNVKSNLHKIPLSFEQLLLSIAEIKSLAKKPLHDFPQIFDESLSFFKATPKSSIPLSFFHLDTQSNETNEVSRTRPNIAKVKKPPEESKKLKGSAQNVITSCRAIRQLIERVSETGEITPSERIALATSMAQTDSREELIHKVLSRTKGYDSETTKQNLKQKNFSSNCMELIKEGICKEPCERYKTANNTLTETPAYFGNIAHDSAWWHSTSAEYIKEVASRLKRYHESTTDIFDWANCEQFLTYQNELSVGISDNIRKGHIIINADEVIMVPKDNGTERTLVKTNFESELISSLFVESAIKSNLKFRQDTLSPHVLSYGYIEADDSKQSLIRSWSSEHNAYKTTLNNVIEGQEFAEVYSDDIKNFYPSVKKNVFNKAIKALFKDARIQEIIETVIYNNKKNLVSGAACDSDLGLPQGILISHIIASRILLEIDDIISRDFRDTEMRLVRYCDDFTFFCKDATVKGRLVNETLPKIERIYGISFHKNVGSEKTFSSNIEDYKANRYEADLYKYQLKFETELAKSSKQNTADLLSLLSSIFGSTLDKYLNNQDKFNKKELERNIATIRWKISGVLNEKSEFREEVKKLCEKIIYFLGKDQISYKLRANLTMLLFSLVDTDADAYHPIIEDLCNLIKTSDLHLSNKLTLIMQLVRYMSLNPAAKSKNLYVTSLSSMGSSAILGEKRCYGELALLAKERTYELENFDFDLWPVKSLHKRKNISAQLKAYSEIRVNVDKMLATYSQAESDINFLIKCNHADLLKNKNIYDVSEKYKLFKYYNLLTLSEIAQVFYEDFSDFSKEKLLTDKDLAEVENQLSQLRDILSTFFHLNEKPKIVKNIDGRNIYQAGNSLFLHEVVKLTKFRGISNNRIFSVCNKISSTQKLGSVFIKVSLENSSIEFISKISDSEATRIRKYLDSTNQLDTWIEAEMNLVDGVTDKTGQHLILSARNLGISETNGRNSIVIINYEAVIKDTLEKNYRLQSNHGVRLPHPNSYNMPGLRLKEAFEDIRNYNENNFPYGYTGWRFIGTLRPDYKSAVFYQSPQSIHKILNKIKSYGESITKGLIDKYTDLLISKTFYLYLNVYFLKNRTRLRKRDNPSYVGVYPFITQSIALTELVNKKLGNSNLYQNFKEKSLFEKSYKPDLFTTTDEMTGYSLIWLSQQSHWAMNQEELNALTMLGSAGMILLDHALEDTQTTLFANSKELTDMQKIIKGGRVSLSTCMKENFSDPDCDKVKELNNVIENTWKSINQFNSKLHSSSRITKIERVEKFDPILEAEKAERTQQIHKVFKRLHVTFEVNDSFRKRMIDIALFNFPSERLKYSLNEKKSGYLTKHFSRLHSWGYQTNEIMTTNGYVAAHGEHFMISVYPNDHVFLPRNIDEHLGIRDSKLRVNFLRIGTIIIFIVFPFLIWFFSKPIEEKRDKLSDSINTQQQGVKTEPTSTSGTVTGDNI